jgi:transcriptional regulator of nitric oxide reductase
MQMLYHSDQFVVVQFDVPSHGGFEIVDRLAGREIYLEGALAESFRQGVQALADRQPTAEDYDAFIERYSALAQQPLRVH